MKPRRNGWALIEVVTVSVVGSVLTGIAIAALAIALRSADRHRTHWNQSHSAYQLGTQFRHDVHQAERIDIVEDKRLCTLAHDDVQVVYRQAPDHIAREEFQAGKPVRRESYAVPSTAEVKILEPASVQPRFVRLQLTSEPDAQQQRAPQLVVEAQLARNHRFVESNERPAESTP